MNIIGVLDLDGFFVQKTFFCKELGIITHGDTYGTSFHFDTTLSYENLSEKDKTSVEFLQRHIHGLSLSDENDLDKDMVDIIVEKILRRIQNKQRKCTGIQGRIYRKRLANKTKHSFNKLRTFRMSQSDKHFPGNGMVRKLRKA